MTYNNINLWFAKDANGKIITIDEVDKELKNTYYCPLCGSEVIARQGDIMSWHFAHIDKSKCDSESMVHFWIKNKLLEVGDTFKIKTDENLEFVAKDILIEQRYSVGDKIYNPDITVITECGKTIYFEVANTNKKKVKEYLDIWIELGNIVVEVDSKGLINSQNKSELEFKALYYNGKCFNVGNKEDNEYYSIIGKYKEKLVNEGLYKINKEKLDKLDWFWTEIKKYKRNINNTNIEDIVTFIDNITLEGEECQNIIYNILTKSKCTDIKSKYEVYKTNEYVNRIKEILGYDFNNYGFDVKVGKNGVNKRIRIVYKSIYDDIEYLSDFIWSKYSFYNENDKNDVIKKIENIIAEREAKKQQIDNWYKIGNVVKKIKNNIFLNPFQFSYAIDEKEHFCDIFIESNNFKKDKIFTINYEKIRGEYKDKKYNILDSEDDIYKVISNNVIEKMNEKRNTLNKWKEETINYNNLKNILYNELIKCPEYIKEVYYNNDGLLCFNDINNNKNILIYKQNKSTEFCNKKYYKNSGENYITIDNFYNEKVYLSCFYNKWGIFYERDLEYEITRMIREYSSAIFGNTKINLTYDRSNEYSRLDRFDFVKVHKELRRLSCDINQFIDKKREHFIEEVKNNLIIDINKCIVQDDIIDEKIKKILYPIYYLVSNSDKNEITITLNGRFTYGEPWFIKDFIKDLTELGFNVENIRRNNI